MATNLNFVIVSHLNLEIKFILNGKQKKINGNKNISNSTWFLHHQDPILRNNFSCSSESMKKPILAVTDPTHAMCSKCFIKF